MEPVTDYQTQISEAQAFTGSQASPMESAVGVSLHRQVRLIVNGVRRGEIAPIEAQRWFNKLMDSEIEAIAAEEVLRTK